MEPRGLGKTIPIVLQVILCPKFYNHVHNTADRQSARYYKTYNKESERAEWQFTELICDGRFQKTVHDSSQAKG